MIPSDVRVKKSLRDLNIVFPSRRRARASRSYATVGRNATFLVVIVTCVGGNFGGGQSPVYAAPLFETGDERYAWLNRVQAIAKGTLDGPTLTYEIAEVR